MAEKIFEKSSNSSLLKCITLAAETVNPNQYNVFLATPSAMLNHEGLLSSISSHGVLIVDDIAGILVNDETKEDFLKVWDKLKKSLNESDFDSLNKLFVSYQFDDQITKNLGTILQIPLVEENESVQHPILPAPTTHSSTPKGLEQKDPPKTPSEDKPPLSLDKKRRRSRSVSPSKSRRSRLTRSRSRGNSHQAKSRSPVSRKGKQEESQRKRKSRSRSRGRRQSRSRSRGRRQSRSRSRGRRQSRSRSRGRRQSRSRSRGRRQSRSRSRGRRQSRSLSKGRRQSRSRSKERRQSRSRLRGRRQSRSLSKGRRQSRSRSKERRQSRSRSKERRQSRSRSRGRQQYSRSPKSSRRHSRSSPTENPDSSPKTLSNYSAKEQKAEIYPVVPLNTLSTSGGLWKPLAASNSYALKNKVDDSEAVVSSTTTTSCPKTQRALFLEAEKKMKRSHEDEFATYVNFPELHPKYDSCYKKFSDKCLKEWGSNYDEKRREEEFSKFWATFCETMKAQIWKKKRTALVNEYKEKSLQLFQNKSKEAPAISPPDESQVKFSVEGALNLLEELSDKQGVLGPAILSIIKTTRELGANTPKGLSVFADSENSMIVKMVVEKFKVLKLTSSPSLSHSLTRVVDWVEELLRLAEKVKQPSIDDLNLDVIAKESLGKDSSFILKSLKSAISLEGIPDLPKEKINELYMKICSIHFNLQME